jgi:hypothetical protein
LREESGIAGVGVSVTLLLSEISLHSKHVSEHGSETLVMMAVLQAGMQHDILASLTGLFR